MIKISERIRSKKDINGSNRKGVLADLRSDTGNDGGGASQDCCGIGEMLIVTFGGEENIVSKGVRTLKRSVDPWFDFGRELPFCKNILHNFAEKRAIEGMFLVRDEGTDVLGINKLKELDGGRGAFRNKAEG